MKISSESIDCKFYKKNYSKQLRNISTDTELYDDYFKNGIKLGRFAHPFQLKDNLCDFISENFSTILEIGCFDKPLFRGNGVKYFEVLERDELVKRSAHDRHRARWRIDNIPEIDYVNPTGSLENINEKFEIVYSCHVIEHQFCLVRHLLETESILTDDGYCIFTIPDKRYMFDYFIADSTIADVLDSYYNPLTNAHSLKSILEHRCLTTHNKRVAHWKGNHGTPVESRSGRHQLGKINSAIEEWKNIEFSDVHKWQFTPNQFINIINILNELGLVRLKVNSIYYTMKGKFEFNVILGY